MEGATHEDIPRCGARTRSGGYCGHYSMQNGRCRYHGGKATGAINPHRPLKHGNYTNEAVEDRRFITSLIKTARKLVREIH